MTVTKKSNSSIGGDTFRRDLNTSRLFPRVKGYQSKRSMITPNEEKIHLILPIKHITPAIGTMSLLQERIDQAQQISARPYSNITPTKS